MKAEHVDGAPKPPQPPARQHRRAVGIERALQHGEVAVQLGRALIRRRGLLGRRAPAGQAERAAGGGKPRIEAGDGAPIGLVLPVRRVIGRMAGEAQHLVRHADQARMQRQLGAERVQLFQIERQRPLALAPKRLAQRLGGDERVAVAVAADPAPHAKERRNLGVAPGRIARGQLVLDLAIEMRQLGEEGVIVIGEAVLDLVDHLEPGLAHQPRLPEGEDGAAQALLAFDLLLRGHARAVAISEQLGDLALAVERALAAHFGRMCGQHRADMAAIEEILKLRAPHAGFDDLAQRGRERALARRRSGDRMGARTADVMLVLGDIGKVGEIGVGADDLDRRCAGNAAEDGRQLGAGVLVLVAVETDRGLADPLDQLEGRLALLGPQRFAEQPPEQADVVAQRNVLLRFVIFRGRGGTIGLADYCHRVTLIGDRCQRRSRFHGRSRPKMAAFTREAISRPRARRRQRGAARGPPMPSLGKADGIWDTPLISVHDGTKS